MEELPAELLFYLTCYTHLCTEEDMLGRLRWTAVYQYATYYNLLDTDFIEMMMEIDREVRRGQS